MIVSLPILLMSAHYFRPSTRIHIEFLNLTHCHIYHTFIFLCFIGLLNLIVNIFLVQFSKFIKSSKVQFPLKRKCGNLPAVIVALSKEFDNFFLVCPSIGRSGTSTFTSMCIHIPKSAVYAHATHLTSRRNLFSPLFEPETL